MSKVEIMKKELELKRVETAQFDMEIRILELHQDIERLQGHIKTQETKAEELKQEIKQLKDSK